MPHVTIEGPCTVRGYWDRFRPGEWSDGSLVIRSIASFLGQGETTALVECAVVEGFLRQVILVQLTQKDNGVLVRLFHASGVERTNGVRRCLGRIGAELLNQDPSCRWGPHTLGIALPPRH